MSLELMSMVGGGLMGFIMRFMASQAEAQQRSLDNAIKAQSVADDSADRAAARGGTWVRRVLAGSVIFGLIFAPFILAFAGLPTYVEDAAPWWDFLGIFSGGFTAIHGYVILPEVRTAMLGIVGFYLGSAQVGSK